MTSHRHHCHVADSATSLLPCSDSSYLASACFAEASTGEAASPTPQQPIAFSPGPHSSCRSLTMSNDPESSIRSSTLTPLSEASHTVNIHSPTTPTPADSVSNRRTELPSRPHPERTSRLPLMPELTAKASAVSSAELQALITEMQHSFQQQLQQQLQQQRRDFENRIESLMIGKCKAPAFS